MISDGWLMIILKYTEYYPIYWGMIHHGNTVLHRPLPVGHCLVSKVEGHVAMWRKHWLLVCWWNLPFWCILSAVFGQKISFFPHFASTILTYFQNSGISWPSKKTSKSWRSNPGISRCPDLSTETSFSVIASRFGPVCPMGRWDFHHFNWWQIKYWIHWTFITFYSWFITNMYSWWYLFSGP